MADTPDVQGFVDKAGVGDALERINDVSALLVGFTDPEDPDAILKAMGGNGLIGCMGELVVGLAMAQSSGIGRDSASGKYFMDLLAAPYNEMKGVLNALFIPPAANASDDISNFSAADLKNLGNAFLNPFASIWSAQFNVLATSFDELVRGVFWDESTEQTGNMSLPQQIVGRVTLAFQQLFLQEQGMVENISGLLLFAIEEGIPAIENEKTYIRMLKKEMKKLVGLSCKLPPSMIPGLPNAITTEHLCIALRELAIVRDGLQNQNKMFRNNFSLATSEVCLAKTSIFDPSKGLSGNLSMQLQNAFGLSDLQFNTLKQAGKGDIGALLPDPRFRIQTIKVRRLNAMIQSVDPTVLQLHKNLMAFQNVLDGFGGIYLGQVFARVIELLRKQIQMLKTQLEADGAGFDVKTQLNNIDELRAFGTQENWESTKQKVAGLTGQPTSSVTATIRTVDGRTVKSSAAQVDEAYNRTQGWAPSDSKNPAFDMNGNRLQAQNQTGHNFVSTEATAKSGDIASYVSTQANAYIMLTSLCFLMDKMQTLYNGVARILAGNDKLMQAIQKFLASYKLQNCGDPYGADDINNAVKNFMQVAEARLAGTVTSNQPVQDAYKAVVQACEKHERFLNCMEESMGLFSKYLKGLAQVLAAYANIMALSRSLSELYTALSTLDLLAVFRRRWNTGNVNVLDVLIRALQCLVLQCNNPFLSSTARYAIRKFQADKDKAISKNVTMGTMDEGPRVAQQMGSNNRLQAFMKLIQAIQRLTSLSIEDLCSIDTKAKAPINLNLNDKKVELKPEGTNINQTVPLKPVVPPPTGTRIGLAENEALA
jgi:hypothetical protein